MIVQLTCRIESADRDALRRQYAEAVQRDPYLSYNTFLRAILVAAIKEQAK